MTAARKLREDASALVVNGGKVYVSNTGSISIDPSELLKSAKVKGDFNEIGNYLLKARSATTSGKILKTRKR